MVPTFLVVLREAFEAALLLGIVYTYLEKTGRTDHYAYATWGAVTGVLASIALGVGISAVSGPLLDLGPDLVGAAVLFLSVGVLTWMLVWMRQHARAIKGDVQRRLDTAESTGQLWLIGVVAFSGVFREGAETVLFVWGLVAQAVGGSGWANLAAGVLGVAAAAVLALAIFRGSRSVSLPRFFTITSVLLLFLAAGLFTAGIGKLQGLGILPMGVELWDTSAILSEKSLLGMLLTGLAGYRARPTALEGAAYLLYLGIAGYFLLWRSPTGGSSRRSEVSPRPAALADHPGVEREAQGPHEGHGHRNGAERGHGAEPVSRRR